jgi:hypothetical protein
MEVVTPGEGLAVGPELEAPTEPLLDSACRFFETLLVANGALQA